MARKPKQVDGTASDTTDESGSGTGTAESAANENSGLGSDDNEIAEAIGNSGDVAKPENDAPIIVKKKRGRKPLSAEERERRAQEKLDNVAEAPIKKPSAKSISTLAGLYVAGNNFVAMRSNAPEFVLNDKDGEIIAEPLSEVLAKWGIRLDGGDNPYLKLAGACIAVYGMRAVAFTMRRKTETPTPSPVARAVPTNVTPFGTPATKVDFSLNQEKVA